MISLLDLDDSRRWQVYQDFAARSVMLSDDRA